MTIQDLDVAIIGAGTAGLSARAEVAKVTDRYRVFDPGPYGTTCARVACMPSKALLQSAHDFHRRHDFEALGISGGDTLQVDSAGVLAETRRLRDSLVDGVIDGMQAWRDTHLVAEAPVFDGDGVLHAGPDRYRPRATVIATGSRPVVPPGWRDRLGDNLLTTDDLFELSDLPARVAVIGLGPVGIEMGQALARLGVEVTAFDPSPALGGATDPEVQSHIHAALGSEMRIVQSEATPETGAKGGVRLSWDAGRVEVDRVLVAMGRRPNLDDLGLEALGVPMSEDGRPDIPRSRCDLPQTRLYFAGDAGPGPALLHEASDEGRIAGYFAANRKEGIFRRRTPLRLVFCSPQLAEAGASWSELEGRTKQIATGEARLDDTGRTRLQRKPGGVLRVYADKPTARIRGAALLAPEAEHLGHLLAHAIDRGEDLRGMLRMPVYHPTHEEALRHALRAALSQCDVEPEALEAIRCEAAPVECAAGDDAA